MGALNLKRRTELTRNRRSIVNSTNAAKKRGEEKKAEKAVSDETSVQVNENAKAQTINSQGKGSSGEATVQERPKVANYKVTIIKPTAFDDSVNQGSYYKGNLDEFFVLTTDDQDEADYEGRKWSDGSPTNRLSNQKEADAVYAKALSMFYPYQNKVNPEEKNVAIDMGGGLVVYYGFDFTPAPIPQENQPAGKPGLNIRFEGKRTAPEIAMKDETVYTSISSSAKIKIKNFISEPRHTEKDATFPDPGKKGVDRQKSYFETNPTEANKVYSVVAQHFEKYAALREKAPAREDVREVLLTSMARYYIHATLYPDTVYKGNFTVRNVDVTYIGPASESLVAEKPLNDENKKSMDYTIEKMQRIPENNKMFGKIVGMDKITDNLERNVVQKYLIEIFKYDHSNETVTQPVVVDRTGKSGEEETYFYKFTFTKPVMQKINGVDIPAIDVYIDRIGKKGNQKGEVADPYNLRIEDVFGFSMNSNTEAQFRTWISTRYRSISAKLPANGTLTDLIASVNAYMNTDAGTTEWFLSNYGLTTYTKTKFIDEYMNTDPKKSLKINFGFQENPASVNSSLKDPQKSEDAVGKNTKDFTPEELKTIELSLQKMAPGLLFMLESTRIIRQNEVYTKSTADAGFDAAGMTFPGKDGKFAVIIDDGGLGAARFGAGFYGGKGGETSPETVNTPTHELGHIFAMRNSETAEKNFNYFIEKYNLLGPTDYSKKVNYAKDNTTKISSPESEFFPEAFDLYINDPEWLLLNRLGLYTWFEYFSEKRTVPAKDDISMNAAFAQEEIDLFK